MKKALLIAASAMLVAVATTRTFGQAQVTFNNSGNQITYGAGNGTNQGLALYGSAGTYEYGLYMGTFGSTSISQMQLVDTVLSIATTGPTATFSGFINSGTINTPGNTANTLAFNSSTEYAFIVAAWTAASGSTYAAALAAAGSETGLSALGFFTPGSGGSSPAAQAFGSSAGQVTAFSIAPVPEPTTLALGGLGAAALLLFRRRK